MQQSPLEVEKDEMPMLQEDNTFYREHMAAIAANQDLSIQVIQGIVAKHIPQVQAIVDANAAGLWGKTAGEKFHFEFSMAAADAPAPIILARMSIESGKILVGGDTVIGPVPTKYRKHPTYNKVFGGLNTTCSMRSDESTIMIDSDGTGFLLALPAPTADLVIQRPFSVNGAERNYQLISLGCKRIGLPSLVIGAELPRIIRERHNQGWLSLEDGDEQLVIIDSTTGKLKYRYHYDSSELHMLDEDGNDSGYVLADPASPAYNSVNMFENPELILVWQFKAATADVSAVGKFGQVYIQLPRYDIGLIGHPSDVPSDYGFVFELESDRTYKLKHGIEEIIPGFSHSLCLELAGRGTRKIIIPRAQFYIDFSDVRSDMYHGRVYDTGIHNMHERLKQISGHVPDSESDLFPPQYSRKEGQPVHFEYYSYQLDETGALVSTSPQATLHLVYVLITKGLYSHAIRSLRSCPTLEGNPREAETIYWILSALTYKPFESNIEPDYIQWERYQIKTPETAAIRLLLCNKVLEEIFYAHSSFKVEALTAAVDAADPMLQCNQYLASRLNNLFSLESFNKTLAKFARRYAFDSSRLSADIKLLPGEIEKVSMWLFEHGYNTGIYAALYKTVVLNSAIAQLTRLQSRLPRRATRYEEREVAILEDLIRSEEELKIAGPTIVEIEDKELGIDFPITKVNTRDFFMSLYNRQIRLSSADPELGLSLGAYIDRFGNDFDKIEFYFKDLFDHIITADAGNDLLSRLEEALANNIRASHTFHSSEDIATRETEEERISRQAKNELIKVLYLLICDKKRGDLAVSRAHFGFTAGDGQPSNENGRTNFARLLERLKDRTFKIDVPVQRNGIVSARTALRDHPTLSMVTYDHFAPAADSFKPLSYADLEALRPDAGLQLEAMASAVGLEEMMAIFSKRASLVKSDSSGKSSLPEGATFVERMDAHIEEEMALGRDMVESDIAFRDTVISVFLPFFNAGEFDLATGENRLGSSLTQRFIEPLDSICDASKALIERLFFKIGDSGEHKAHGLASLRQHIDFSQILMLSIFGSPEIYHRFNDSLSADDIDQIYQESFRYIQAALLLQRYTRAANEVHSLAGRILELKATLESSDEAIVVGALSDINWGDDYKCKSIITRICTQLFSPDHSTELLKLLESPDESMFSALQEGGVLVDLDPSMFATLSYFQYMRSVLLRDEQISYLLHMRRFIDSPETKGMIISAVYQMIMGFGKSKMVSPMDIVFALMSNPGGLVVVEVPESLIHTFFQDTDAQTRHFGHRARLLRVNRDSINTPSDLRMILNIVEGAKSRGDYIITEGNGIPALYLMMQTITLERPNVSRDSEEYIEWSEKVILANRIMSIISHPSAVLMDEVDSLINPLSKFIFSFTPPKPIEPNRARWNTRMMLSLEHVDISDIVIPPQPEGTYNFLDVIRRKHPERRAEDKLIHTEEQWQAVMVKIANFLVSNPESPLQTDLLEGDRGPAIVEYLLDKQDKPGFFAALPDNMQQQIDLYYAYVNKLLHFTVVEKGNYLVENGPIDPYSPDPIKRMISKPYKGADAPDTSDWGNPDVLMIFSLFNLIILGLRESDIKNMINSLQFIALEEMRQHTERKPEDTQPAIQFAEMYAKLKEQIDSQLATGAPEIVTPVLIADIASDEITVPLMLDYLSKLKLNEIDAEKPQFVVLCRLLSKNREFNEYFFTNPHGIAKHVHTMTKTLECTAAQHLMCYGNRNIRGMSGDPWTASSFPSDIFPANKTVGMGTTGRILRYMQEANITTTCADTDPYVVLERQVDSVRARAPGDVSSVKALIDLEAKFKGQSNKHCASRFADYFTDHRDEHPSIKYVIFLKSFRDEFGFINQKLYALNVDSREEVKLDTSDYEKIRRILGVDCDSYFVYFSQFGGTRGLDVKLAPGSIFTLLIDSDAKLFEIEQAALRARELSIFGQKLIISVDHSFREKVQEVIGAPLRADEDVTFDHIVRVAHRNQVETLEPLNITGCIDMLHAIVAYYCNLLKDGQTPDHQHLIAIAFQEFIASTTPSHLSKLYGIRPKEKESRVIFTELKDEILRRFLDLARDLDREILEQTVKSSDLERFGIADDSAPVSIGDALVLASRSMDAWMTREIEHFVPRCPKRYKLTGNSGADSQVTIQHQVKTRTKVATYLQDFDLRAEALPPSIWVRELAGGPDLYDLRPAIAAANIVPLEDIFQYSGIEEKGWSFDRHIMASKGFMLTTTAHRDGRSSRLDAYSKPVEYILFANSGAPNRLNCILLSKSEADALLQRMLSSDVPVPGEQNFWIERVSGIRVIGRGPTEEDLKSTNYHTLQEQARLMGGHVQLLSRQSAPLVWLTKDSGPKLKFLVETVLPKHNVEPADLENLQRRVSALSKYFNMVFEADDFTPMENVAYWAQFPGEIEEDDRQVLSKMATLFSRISSINDLAAVELDDQLDWSAPPHLYPATAVIIIKEFVRKRIRNLRIVELLENPVEFELSALRDIVSEIHAQNPELASKVINEDKFGDCRGLLQFACKSLNHTVLDTFFYLLKMGGQPKLPELSGKCSVMHTVMADLSELDKVSLLDTSIESIGLSPKQLHAFIDGLLATDVSGVSALSVLIDPVAAEHPESVNNFLSYLLDFCSQHDDFVPYLARIVSDQHSHIHDLDLATRLDSPIISAIKSLAFEKWLPGSLAKIIASQPQIALLKSDISGNTILHQAVLKNDHNLIKIILASSPNTILQANKALKTIKDLIAEPSEETGIAEETKALIRGCLARLEALSTMVSSNTENGAAIEELIAESPELVNAQISLSCEEELPPINLMLALFLQGKVSTAQSLITSYKGKVALDCLAPIKNFSLLHIMSAHSTTMVCGSAAASMAGPVLEERDQRLSTFVQSINLANLVGKFIYHEDCEGQTPISLMLEPTATSYSSYSYSILLEEIIKFDLEREQRADYKDVLLRVYPVTFQPNQIAKLILQKINLESADNIRCLREFFSELYSQGKPGGIFSLLPIILGRISLLLEKSDVNLVDFEGNPEHIVEVIEFLREQVIAYYMETPEYQVRLLGLLGLESGAVPTKLNAILCDSAMCISLEKHELCATFLENVLGEMHHILRSDDLTRVSNPKSFDGLASALEKINSSGMDFINRVITKNMYELSLTAEELFDSKRELIDIIKVFSFRYASFCSHKGVLICDSEEAAAKIVPSFTLDDDFVMPIVEDAKSCRTCNFLLLPSMFNGLHSVTGDILSTMMLSCTLSKLSDSDLEAPVFTRRSDLIFILQPLLDVFKESQSRPTFAYDSSFTILARAFKTGNTNVIRALILESIQRYPERAADYLTKPAASLSVDGTVSIASYAINYVADCIIRACAPGSSRMQKMRACTVASNIELLPHMGTTTITEVSPLGGIRASIAERAPELLIPDASLIATVDAITSLPVGELEEDKSLLLQHTAQYIGWYARQIVSKEGLTVLHRIPRSEQYIPVVEKILQFVDFAAENNALGYFLNALIENKRSFEKEFNKYVKLGNVALYGKDISSAAYEIIISHCALHLARKIGKTIRDKGERGRESHDLTGFFDNILRLSSNLVFYNNPEFFVGEAKNLMLEFHKRDHAHELGVIGSIMFENHDIDEMLGLVLSAIKEHLHSLSGTQLLSADDAALEPQATRFVHNYLANMLKGFSIYAAAKPELVLKVMSVLSKPSFKISAPIIEICDESGAITGTDINFFDLISEGFIQSPTLAHLEELTASMLRYYSGNIAAVYLNNFWNRFFSVLAGSDVPKDEVSIVILQYLVTCLSSKDHLNSIIHSDFEVDMDKVVLFYESLNVEQTLKPMLALILECQGVENLCEVVTSLSSDPICPSTFLRSVMAGPCELTSSPGTTATLFREIVDLITLEAAPEELDLPCKDRALCALFRTAGAHNFLEKVDSKDPSGSIIYALCDRGALPPGLVRTMKDMSLFNLEIDLNRIMSIMSRNLVAGTQDSETRLAGVRRRYCSEFLLDSLWFLSAYYLTEEPKVPEQLELQLLKGDATRSLFHEADNLMGAADIGDSKLALSVILSHFTFQHLASGDVDKFQLLLSVCKKFNEQGVVKNLLRCYEGQNNVLHFVLENRILRQDHVARLIQVLPELLTTENEAHVQPIAILKDAFPDALGRINEVVLSSSRILHINTLRQFIRDNATEIASGFGELISPYLQAVAREEIENRAVIHFDILFSELASLNRVADLSSILSKTHSAALINEDIFRCILSNLAKVTEPLSTIVPILNSSISRTFASVAFTNVGMVCDVIKSNLLEPHSEEESNRNIATLNYILLSRLIGCESVLVADNRLHIVSAILQSFKFIIRNYPDDINILIRDLCEIDKKRGLELITEAVSVQSGSATAADERESAVLCLLAEAEFARGISFNESSLRELLFTIRDVGKLSDIRLFENLPDDRAFVRSKFAHDMICDIIGIAPIELIREGEDFITRLILSANSTSAVYLTDKILMSKSVYNRNFVVRIISDMIRDGASVVSPVEKMKLRDIVRTILSKSDILDTTRFFEDIIKRYLQMYTNELVPNNADVMVCEAIDILAENDSFDFFNLFRASQAGESLMALLLANNSISKGSDVGSLNASIVKIFEYMVERLRSEEDLKLLSDVLRNITPVDILNVILTEGNVLERFSGRYTCLLHAIIDSARPGSPILETFMLTVVSARSIVDFKCLPHALSKMGPRTPEALKEEGITHVRDILRSAGKSPITEEDLETFTLLVKEHPDFIRSVNVGTLPQTGLCCPGPVYRAVIDNNPALIMDLQNYGILSSIIAYLLADIDSATTTAAIDNYSRILEDYVKPAIEGMMLRGKSLSQVSYHGGTAVAGMLTNASEIESYAIELQATVDDVCTKRAETKRLSLSA